MIICFDVDGTLIDYDDNPRPEIIRLLKAFSDADFEIIVWSGGGAEYAEYVVRQLGLDSYVNDTMAKNRDAPHGTIFTVDDMPGAVFGVPNLYVGHQLTHDEKIAMINQQRRAIAMFPR